MPKILNLHDDPYVGVLTSEALTQEGYQVVSLNNVDLIWEHIENIQPKVVLLDSDPDGFGAMKLYFKIKQKYADLPVIVYRTGGFDAMDRIKAAIDEILSEKRNSI
jgi:DNA-binding NtrC family response regulator